MANHKIKTSIISVSEAISEGHKGFSGERNPQYRGRIPGYLTAFCVEVRHADGTLGSSSSVYLEEWQKEDSIIYSDTWDGEFNELGEMADLCLHDGNEITGRLIFNGYYESYYDFEEREECVREKTDEVDRLWGEYVS